MQTHKLHTHTHTHTPTHSHPHTLTQRTTNPQLHHPPTLLHLKHSFVHSIPHSITEPNKVPECSNIRKIVTLCSGVAFLVFRLFLANSFSFSLLYASSLRPAGNLLAYTGYPDLYFCMSLERSMSCSWTSNVSPTDQPR